MKLYVGVSLKVVEIMKGFAEKFQQVSVAEAYFYQDLESEILKKLAYTYSG
jgi:hypothetical protein